ncbi:hypothetical protein [Microbacterium pumilum]|uniref:DUF3566 domain-containing protein n=1 Tax=Microbacterium pumilum TaxID=344165 RepID=A0ABP5DAH6_9MICO
MSNPAPTPNAGAPRFDVHSQSAGAINNVGRDQYTSYVAHIQSQRESFLRDVAATRSKARWLVWLGLLGILAGTSIFLWIFAGYFDAFADAFRNMGDPTAFEYVFEAGFGQEIAGVNALIVGLGAAMIGQVMVIVGIILHIVATARRRRVDRELTVPAPWNFAG